MTMHKRMDWAQRALWSITAACSLAGVTHATAQPCAGQWLAGEPPPIVSSPYVTNAVLWDPDGPGPRGPMLVLTGEFFHAFGINAPRIIGWDPVTNDIERFGGGVTGAGFQLITSITADGWGGLIIAGHFTNAGGTPVTNIARWHGDAWSSLGGGVNGRVYGVVTAPDGSVIAGGSFTQAGGVPVGGLARWDGNSWSAFAPGGPSNTITALAIAPDGVLSAAFDIALGSSIVAAFDGTSWASLGGGIDGFVKILCATSAGHVVASGGFDTIGGLSRSRIALWNGTEWDPMGTSSALPTGTIFSLMAHPSGGVVVGGSFESIRGVPASRIAVWDGDSWSTWGAGLQVPEMEFGYVHALCMMPNGDVFVGGSFTRVGDVDTGGVARWTGSDWRALTNGFNGPVHAMARLPDGGVVAVGEFTTVGGVSARRVARWDGVNWTPFPVGLPIAPTTVAVLDDGSIIVNDATTPGSRVRRWTGDAWEALGAPFNNDNSVSTLLPLDNGEFLAGGTFTYADVQPLSRMARWNGSSWHPFAAGAAGPVRTFLHLADGDLIAAGQFSTIGGTPALNIARWDGTSWSPYGMGVSGTIRVVLERSDGSLVAGGTVFPGSIPPVDGVAVWTGESWQRLGTGLARSHSSPVSVTGMVETRAGHLLVAGAFTHAGGSPVHNVARWDGTSWYDVAGGLEAHIGSFVNAMTTHESGEVLVAGQFYTAGGRPSASFARWAESNTPRAALHPHDTAACAPLIVTFHATPATGYDGLHVRWQRDGVDIADGPGGASPGGGTVHGATATLISPSNGAPSVLTISNLQPGDAGLYRAVFFNACGEAGSNPAVLTVYSRTDPACALPCNADYTQDGVLDQDDIACLTQIVAGDPSCSDADPDFNGDGNVDQDDIDALAQVVAGAECP